MLNVEMGVLSPATLAEATQMVRAFWPDAVRVGGVVSVFPGWTYHALGVQVAKVEKYCDGLYKVTYLVKPALQCHAEIGYLVDSPDSSGEELEATL